jgi:hypothetical protein
VGCEYGFDGAVVVKRGIVIVGDSLPRCGREPWLSAKTVVAFSEHTARIGAGVAVGRVEVLSPKVVYP